MRKVGQTCLCGPGSPGTKCLPGQTLLCESLVGRSLFYGSFCCRPLIWGLCSAGLFSVGLWCGNLWRGGGG